jgi:hypothetical protein
MEVMVEMAQAQSPQATVAPNAVGAEAEAGAATLVMFFFAAIL